MEHDRAHPLGGWVELGDACLGGERSGGKRGPTTGRRAASDGTFFIANTPYMDYI